MYPYLPHRVQNRLATAVTIQTLQLRATVNAAGGAILIDGKLVDQLWQHENLFFDALRPYDLNSTEQNMGFISFNIDTEFADSGSACPAACPPGPPGPSGAMILSGVGPPTCAIGQTSDLYVDLTIGQLYFKTVQPTQPSVRSRRRQAPPIS